MKQTYDPLRSQLLEMCKEGSEHLALLRDFATTPGNIWLAASELTKIQQLLGEIETLLVDIKTADTNADSASN